MAAIGGVIRVSAISAMFEGDKRLRAHTIRAERRMHETRKEECGMECSSNATSNVRLLKKKKGSKPP